jgi:hypothetical protein
MLARRDGQASGHFQTQQDQVTTRPVEQGLKAAGLREEATAFGLVAGDLHEQGR